MKKEKKLKLFGEGTAFKNLKEFLKAEKKKQEEIWKVKE